MNFSKYPTPGGGSIAVEAAGPARRSDSAGFRETLTPGHFRTKS
jgi:hypothetical protein